jgi:hypothetical protein
MDDQDGSRISLKIVLILSIMLVMMDTYELYFTYGRLVEYSQKFELIVFENCIKYHVISQMFFTSFATFSGISAALMSLGLLVNYEFFSVKCIDTFLYLNYIIFGPYLLSTCVLGYSNFGLIAYNCEAGNIDKKYLNFSTLLALLVCSVMSMLLTLGFSVVYGFLKMKNSIRFRSGGNYILGRLFWRYVFNRTRQISDANEVEMNEVGMGNRARRGVDRRGDNLNNMNNQQIPDIPQQDVVIIN